MKQTTKTKTKTTIVFAETSRMNSKKHKKRGTTPSVFMELITPNRELREHRLDDPPIDGWIPQKLEITPKPKSFS
jgi:hypothetical protein